MTRLFAAMCNEPHRLKYALYPIRQALMVPGADLGWGMGQAAALERGLSRDNGQVAEAGETLDYIHGHAVAEQAVHRVMGVVL